MGQPLDILRHARPVDGNGDGIGGPDIGAYEAAAMALKPQPAPLPADSGASAVPGDATGGTAATGSGATAATPTCAATAPASTPVVTTADLLAGLRRTLAAGRATRKGGRYAHAFVAGGRLTVTWWRGRTLVARGTIARTASGAARLVVRPTRRGRALLRRGVRLRVRGTLSTGTVTVRAARRQAVR